MEQMFIQDGIREDGGFAQIYIYININKSSDSWNGLKRKTYLLFVS